MELKALNVSVAYNLQNGGIQLSADGILEDEGWEKRLAGDLQLTPEEMQQLISALALIPAAVRRREGI